MPKPADNRNRQGQGKQAGAEVPPAASAGTPPEPDGGTPPAPPTGSGGKKRVKCESLKGKKVIIGKGGAVRIDENGFFEVGAEEAEWLLTIPGYEEA
jgi:hypothetical protein